MDALWIMSQEAKDGFQKGHTFHPETQLHTVRRLALSYTTDTLEFSSRRNASVDRNFQRKLRRGNLTATWTAVETGPKSVVVETE